MAIYLHKFNTEQEYNNKRNNEYVEPWVSATNTGTEASFRVNYNKTDYEKPLTFEIISDGNIVWKANTNNTSFKKTIQYKINDGEWTNITSTTGGTSFNVVSGDIVQFRGDNDQYYNSNYYYNYFNGSCTFKAKGNIMSLLNSTDFATATTLESAYTFDSLFHACTGLTDASELILPATTLSDHCYCNMFEQCANLIAVPELPARILTNACYCNMFRDCTSLSNIPFNYLPVTTLATRCYSGMFNCTNIVTAPELPATTLVEQCYRDMFSGCTNLNYIKCLGTTFGSVYTYQWVQGVAASGTFVKNPNMTEWSTGNDYIPNNWIVQDAS